MRADTIDAVEIIWSILSVVGFVVSGRNYLRARSDLGNAVVFDVNGAKRMTLARTKVRELGRVYTHTLFIFIGVVSLTQPSPPAPSTTARVLTVVAFMAVQIILIANSYLDYRYQEQLLDYLEPSSSPRDLRDEGQDAREVEQNERETFQNKIERDT